MVSSDGDNSDGDSNGKVMLYSSMWDRVMVIHTPDVILFSDGDK